MACFMFRLIILSNMGIDEIKIEVYNAISFALFGLFNAFYCSAHWIFAMKYWTASYKLGQGKMIRIVNVVYYFILILNIAICVFEAVEEGMDLKYFELSYAMLVWIQMFSCLV